MFSLQFITIIIILYQLLTTGCARRFESARGTGLAKYKYVKSFYKTIIFHAILLVRTYNFSWFSCWIPRGSIITFHLRIFIISIITALHILLFLFITVVIIIIINAVSYDKLAIKCLVDFEMMVNVNQVKK